MEIALTNASPEELASYGQIIDVPKNHNPTFFSGYFKYWKQELIVEIDNPIEVGYLQIDYHEMTFRQMERHDKTPELLIPLTGDFIIPVALKNNTVPDCKEVKAFRINQGQAILLNPNCWHWLPFPVTGHISVLILFKNNTSLNDLIIEDMSEECMIKIPPGNN